jgi:cobalt-zinc-cadmium efflux system outer membrane protein
MLIGAFDLLMAKQQEFEAYQKYLETLRDYWIVRADMQRSLGGRLPGHMNSKQNIEPNTAAENKMKNQDFRAQKRTK